MPREKGNFSFIDLEKGDVAYCPTCETAGMYYNKLGEVPLQEDGKPLPDADNWCQCKHGHRFAIYQRKQEGQFSYFKDTVSNPFDTTSTFEASKKRKHKDRLDSYKEDLDI